jgi:hypothetical protein
MNALHTVRTAPLRAAVRIQTMSAEGGDAGMTSAEYAVGTVAACGFGGVLYKVVTSDLVKGLVSGLFEKALEFAF